MILSILPILTKEEAQKAAKKLSAIDKKEWEIAGDTIVTTSKKAITLLKESTKFKPGDYIICIDCKVPEKYMIQMKDL